MGLLLSSKGRESLLKYLFSHFKGELPEGGEQICLLGLKLRHFKLVHVWSLKCEEWLLLPLGIKLFTSWPLELLLELLEPWEAHVWVELLISLLKLLVGLLKLLIGLPELLGVVLFGLWRRGIIIEGFFGRI